MQEEAAKCSKITDLLGRGVGQRAEAAGVANDGDGAGANSPIAGALMLANICECVMCKVGFGKLHISSRCPVQEAN